MYAWRTLFGFLACLALSSAQANTLCPPRQPIQFAHHQFGYFYIDHSGIDADLVAEMAKRSGCRFSETVKPRSRIWRELEEGSLDMAGNGIETAQRKQFAAFIPYMAVRTKLLYLGNDVAPATVDDLVHQPVRVGIVRSFKHGEPYDTALEQLRQQGQVVEARDMQQLFEWLQKDRINVAITHPVVYQRYLPMLQLDKLQIVDLATQQPTLKVGVVLSRKRFSAEQIEGWSKLLQAMRDDGTLHAIFSQHIGPDNADAALRQLPTAGK